MTTKVVDTTVLIHLLRNNTIAIAWVNAQPHKLSITPISWMEVIDGAGSKAAQQQAKHVLSRFDMIYFVDSDLQWAMQQLESYRLSHGLHIMDCLIASVSYRLQIPLYTHNLKDMGVLLGPNLAVKPY